MAGVGSAGQITASFAAVVDWTDQAQGLSSEDLLTAVEDAPGDLSAATVVRFLHALQVFRSDTPQDRYLPEPVLLHCWHRALR